MVKSWMFSKPAVTAARGWYVSDVLVTLSVVSLTFIKTIRQVLNL